MKAPAIPRNDALRLLALENLCLLDTASEERFDRITRVAQAHFKVPIALVSLVDKERQWFKSRQGLDATETPRDISFCGHAILQDDVFVIGNALEDERFADNPLVTGAPKIRFYAGAPLFAPGGERVGTLCIIDVEPRHLSTEQVSTLRDLADGVEAEMERTALLQASDTASELSLIVEYSANSAIVTDAEGRIIRVNRGFEKLTGYSQEEVLGRKPGHLLQGPDSDRDVVARMSKARAEGRGFAEQLINYKKNGEPYWIDIRAKPVRDKAGKVIKFVAIETDLTEQRIASLNFENQISAINKSQLVAEFETDGTIITANSLFCQTVGYDCKELPGQKHAIFMPEQERDTDSYRDFWKMLRQGIHQSGEFRRVAKDGSDVWIQATYSPILNQKGEVTKVVKFATDITEAITNRNLVKDQAARTNAILETVVDAIVTIDRDGTVENFTPAAQKMFGYRESEVVGKNVKMLMPDPYRSGHDQYLRSYLETGQAKVIGIGREVTGLRKDGTTFPMELAVSEMQVGGRRMFTGIARDITDQKHAADELKRLNDDLSQRVMALDAMNEINAHLHQMNAYFQTAESEEELLGALVKFCQRVFDEEVGAYFTIQSNKMVEQILTWGRDFKGETDFKVNDCWALRQGEPKVLSSRDDHLICRHLDRDNLDHSICCPVTTRDGMVGLLSIYGPRSEAEIEAQKIDRLNRNREVLEAVAERLGTAIANLKLRERLHHESVRDPLTRLFNRRFFDETFELEMRRSKRADSPISVLLLDADHFKRFNDDHGHEAGDLVLQAMAEILRDSCRLEDLPCRYGGEEFALVLVGMDKGEALEKAETIRKIVELATIEYKGNPLPKLTVSCGVASIPEDALEQSECLRLADKALYQAKETGRNKVVGAGAA
ncbi:PAS domain S-box protein [Magnetospira sp. QH-2]|uniref:PAS domain S-box protein n=1 Tax=Magnetospira sp. (strain QH-2) TaxID=1288970 RepID=UPI0003E81A9B|nr:PAS domain S-box protein [Magnetospira sp. QH-2]CCQ72824.1 Putative enzyme has diguanylate cyclase domain [Magnetospira sp. QH-2]